MHIRSVALMTMFALLGVSALAEDYRFNFGPESEMLPEGWLDAGSQSYDAGRGWGWTQPPGLDRKRGVLDDPVMDSLVAVYPGSDEAVFQVDLPNGVYRVTATASDPGFKFGAHWLLNDDAEVWVLEKDLPKGSKLVKVREVEISDGKLLLRLRPTDNRPNIPFCILSALEIEALGEVESDSGNSASAEDAVDTGTNPE